MSLNIFNENNFDEEVLKSNETVIVDFYADWCGPCRAMAPVIDALAEENLENVKVGKINVDENSNIAEKYEIMTIPTIMIFKNGEILKKFIGMTDSEEIKRVVL